MTVFTIEQNFIIAQMPESGTYHKGVLIHLFLCIFSRVMISGMTHGSAKLKKERKFAVSDFFSDPMNRICDASTWDSF